MKVGDLVKKKDANIPCVGLLVYLVAGIARVNWFSYGTYMTPAHTLVVINEAR